MANEKTNTDRDYESQPGFHRHKCRRCGQVWEHPDSCSNSIEAHVCSCGTLESIKYKGPESPKEKPAIDSKLKILLKDMIAEFDL
jgi:hypothetical protein